MAVNALTVHARTNVPVYDASSVSQSDCCLLLCCMCVCVAVIISSPFAKMYKKETCPSFPDAPPRLGVSAGGLGGTRTLTLFMVCEEDLIYDPAHLHRPPMALIQTDLWGVLQHLKEWDKRARMKRGGDNIDLLLPGGLVGR